MADETVSQLVDKLVDTSVERLAVLKAAEMVDGKVGE